MTTPLALIASCLDAYDPEALPVPQAQAFIARLVQPVHDVDSLPLAAALGRTLAEDITCGIDVPAHDNSAMDGYSLAGSDLSLGRLPLAGGAFAGHAFAGRPPARHAVRIMTGAVMPEGHDTVIPQELVHVEGDQVVFDPGSVRSGDNRRRRGEDMAVGQRALQRGRRLRPADVGLLAALGQAQVPVFRRARVAFFSTGDELQAVGTPLPPGGVYDSNRHTMAALLQRLDVEGIDLGLVRDDPAALEAALHAASHCDAVLTTGGVSVGDADHTRATLSRVGEVLFWKIAMRPGRPMAVGRLAGGTLLFGLPGNPVAVMVSFYAMVRDALLLLGGATPEPALMLPAVSLSALRKKPGRTEYQRGVLSRTADGRLQVDVTGEQGSGVLSSMSQANALIVLPHERGPVAVGETVDVLPFDGLV